MKHMIILPADSPLDSGWAGRLEGHYGQYFDSIYTQTYSHWDLEDNSEIDLMIEGEKLQQHMASLPPEAKVVVFAKYAGAILAILTSQPGPLKPGHSFFFGPSFDWANRHVLSGDYSAVESYNLPTTIFHSQYDQVSSYVICKKTLAEHLKNIPLVTTSGYEFTYDNHDSYDEVILPILTTLGIKSEV